MPGWGLSFGIMLTMLSLVVLIPIGFLLWRGFVGFGAAGIWEVVNRPRVWSALELSFRAALIASLFNLVFGVILAWVLVPRTGSPASFAERTLRGPDRTAAVIGAGLLGLVAIAVLDLIDTGLVVLAVVVGVVLLATRERRAGIVPGPSSRRSAPTTVAGSTRPSKRRTESSSAPSMTWLFVTT